MADVLSHKRFHDEQAAYDWVESQLWPDGPTCPKCFATHARVTKLQGKSTRIGVYKCKDCRKPFSVTVGTVMERSHIPLSKWVLAAQFMASSKKGISAHQLHRTLEIGYKAAWFLAHRIREAMRSGALAPMGGNGKQVEVDETYIGRMKGAPVTRGGSHKNSVVTLVERGGIARSFHVDTARMGNVMPIVRANIARESALMTDESGIYRRAGQDFASHEFVTHSKDEYGRGDVHTNTVEGYYSIFKRGMKGVYQHCGEQHLQRYLAEFDFRYSHRIALGVDDRNRTVKAMAGIVGKRFKYRVSLT